MLPKVRTPGDVEMTDKLLTQIELANGCEVGRIGIEAQIEDATGLIACEAIAAASPRMETLIFGPGDYSAAVGIPITTIGARARTGIPATISTTSTRGWSSRPARPASRRSTGPTGTSRTTTACATRSQLARALGLDGKWTIHPGQIDVVNEVFSPARDAVGARRGDARRLRAGAPRRRRARRSSRAR